jgi:hypothetical protein
MQLEISTGGVDVVVSRGRNSRTDNDGRQKANSGTGARCREVSWSPWLARAWRSPRSTPPNNRGHYAISRNGLVTLVITA